MKQILFVGINAKYIHSNLAVRCLKEYAEAHGVESAVSVAEYTINQSADEILADIVSFSPDVIGFSCYIFNIETVLKLVQNLKSVLPGCIVFLGGPEAGTNRFPLMERYKEIDFVVRGEGEQPVAALLRALERDCAEYAEIPSIFYRDGNRLSETPLSEPLMGSGLPYHYSKEEIERLEHKIIYFESSRGCPFRCSYCLSSADKRLRFFPLDEVLDQFKLFLDCRVHQVKLIDRTFNCDAERALSVWRFLEAHDNGITNFHFEIAADLLTPDQLQLLSRVRPGLIQLEIGVQSTNPETIRAVHRKTDWETARKKIAEVIRGQNVHVHLDLIAGLPKEGLSSFQNSFDEVYFLHPHQLQLGFLKLLSGSILADEAERYGIICRKYPPYEVLKTDRLSFQELTFLKHIEALVDLFYNSGRFRACLSLLEPFFETPFGLYENLEKCLEKKGITTRQLGKYGGYELLLELCEARDPSRLLSLRHAAKYDIFSRERVQVLPDFLKLSITKQNSREIKNVLSSLFDGADPKEYQVEYFPGNFFLPEGYICFHYGKRDLYGNAETVFLPL